MLKHNTILVCTIPEAAKVLQCSERSIRRMIANGDLPAEKIEGEHGLEWQITWKPVIEQPETSLSG